MGYFCMNFRRIIEGRTAGIFVHVRKYICSKMQWQLFLTIYWGIFNINEELADSPMDVTIEIFVD